MDTDTAQYVNGHRCITRKNNRWTKRDKDTGRFMDQKADDKPRILFSEELSDYKNLPIKKLSLNKTWRTSVVSVAATH